MEEAGDLTMVCPPTQQVNLCRRIDPGIQRKYIDHMNTYVLKHSHIDMHLGIDLSLMITESHEHNHITIWSQIPPTSIIMVHTNSTQVKKGTVRLVNTKALISQC